MSVVLSEHLPLLATAPDGVRKLRGLILELAVRGKLVPQDPNDEPASELLKRIAQERAKLQVEGVLKKAKSLLPVGVTELSFEVPVGWSLCRFSEFALDISTGPFGSMLHQSDYIDGGIPLVNPSHMVNGWIVPERDVAVSEEKAAELSSYRLSEGDIVMARRGEVGRTAVVTERERGWLCGTGSFVIHLDEETSRSFVVMLFRSASVRRYLGDEAVGTTMVNLNHSILKSMPVAIPPLAEQHRIVAKVEELMALSDRLETEQVDAEAAHTKLVNTLLSVLTQSANAAALTANWQLLAAHFDTLFTTESSLNALKQTILQLAVMGKLVPQDPDDESASDLFERIVQERAQLEAAGACKKSKPMVPVKEDERKFELPRTWEWVRFGSIADTRLGKMLDAAKNRGQLKPYLRNTNVQWWRFDLDDIKEMRLTDDELHEFRLTKGDLLICEGGEPGRCAIWRSELDEMYFQKALHRARPFGGCVSEYLQIMLRQDAVSGVLSSYFTGATIKHFPGDKLSSYVLPLPPVAEQHRIVAKVDELMVLCDRLMADIAESRSHQKRLASTLIETALQAA